MRSDEIMKKDVQCVSPEDDIRAAATIMRDRNIGFVPVCDQAGRVLGTITDRDLCIRVLPEGKPPTTKVAECMTHEVVSCLPSDGIARVEELLGEHHVSRLLVIDEQGSLRGVISLSDIAQHDKGRRVAETLRRVTEREASIR